METQRRRRHEIEAREEVGSVINYNKHPFRYVICGILPYTFSGYNTLLPWMDNDSSSNTTRTFGGQGDIKIFLFYFENIATYGKEK